MPAHDRRIAWSPAERTTMLQRAAAIQAERPDLSGLPLLRAAMQSLPPGRRRKIRSLSAAPWFEPGMRLIARANLAQTPVRLEDGWKEWRESIIELLNAILAAVSAKSQKSENR